MVALALDAYKRFEIAPSPRDRVTPKVFGSFPLIKTSILHSVSKPLESSPHYFTIKMRVFPVIFQHCAASASPSISWVFVAN